MSVGRVLVTGGVRSGKSRHAEGLLAAEASVLYVAAGPSYDDADWAARVGAHRERRPATWTTLETRDLADAVAGGEGPVLIDCLGTWLTGLVDDAGAWEASTDELERLVHEHTAPLVAALGAARAPVVVVTNEVGLGVVPEHRSARVFRDLLGRVNQEVGAACDEVHLVVAGRVLRLTEPAAGAGD